METATKTTFKRQLVTSERAELKQIFVLLLEIADPTANPIRSQARVPDTAMHRILYWNFKDDKNALRLQ